MMRLEMETNPPYVRPRDVLSKHEAIILSITEALEDYENSILDNKDESSESPL